MSKQVMDILEELKQKNPDKDLEQLVDMATYSALLLHKGRASYRPPTCAQLCFERAQYQCTENCGVLSLGVVLTGGTGRDTFLVDYCTENGSARAGVDYGFQAGTLVFGPGDTRQEVKVRDLCDPDLSPRSPHQLLSSSLLSRWTSWTTMSLRKTANSLCASRISVPEKEDTSRQEVPPGDSWWSLCLLLSPSYMMTTAASSSSASRSCAEARARAR